MTLNGISIGDQVFAVHLDNLKIYHSYVTSIHVTDENAVIEVAEGPAVFAERVFKTLESAQAYIIANVKMVEVKKETSVRYVSDDNNPLGITVDINGCANLPNWGTIRVK